MQACNDIIREISNCCAANFLFVRDGSHCDPLTFYWYTCCACGRTCQPVEKKMVNYRQEGSIYVNAKA